MLLSYQGMVSHQTSVLTLVWLFLQILFYFCGDRGSCCPRRPCLLVLCLCLLSAGVTGLPSMLTNSVPVLIVQLCGTNLTH